MSEDTPIYQPEAPAVKLKPKYKLDDAGVLTRCVGEQSQPIAVYRDGVVTIISGYVEYKQTAMKAFERMGYKVKSVVVASAADAPAEVIVPEVEPATEAHLGERTPAWLAWLKKTDPKRHAAVCERLKISDQPIEINVEEYTPHPFYGYPMDK